jgi:Ca2+-binding EF-hand superfamily protein/diadenosine tetraphosphatase ApaH/serine/threonine PP2A family protein phosphatase
MADGVVAAGSQAKPPLLKTSLGQKRLTKYDSLTKVWNELDVHEEQTTVEVDATIEKMEKVAAQQAAKNSPRQQENLKKRQQLLMLAKQNKSSKLFQFGSGPAAVPSPLTLAYVVSLHDLVASGKTIALGTARSIVAEILQLFETQRDDNLNRIKIPSSARLVVVGDIHGQLADLLHIFYKAGWPSETNMFLFNGDFVDRGPNGAEVLLLLYCFKLLFPKHFFMNRGNHECRAMNAKYSFEDEVLKKYDRELYDKIQTSFELLPICALVQDKIMVIHGGLFSNDVTISDIEKVNRVRQIPISEKGPLDLIYTEAMWSDPRAIPFREPNKRGAGIFFGHEVTSSFLTRNKLSLVIRSHELCDEGHQWWHYKRCLTLFSASNYCGKNKNHGAYVVLEGNDPDLHPHILKYRVSGAGHRYVSKQSLTTPSAPAPAGAVPSSGGFAAAAAGDAAISDGSGVDDKLRPVDIAKLKADTIAQLKQHIFVHKQELLDHFRKTYKDQLHITPEQWGHSLSHVIKLDIIWTEMLKYLARLESDGKINYASFLEAYVLELPTVRRLQDQLTLEAAHSLLQQIPTISLHLKDIESSHGCVQLLEFTHVIKGASVGISEKGAEAVFTTVDNDHDGRISTKAFVDWLHKETARLRELKKGQDWIPAAVQLLKSAVAAGRPVVDFDKNNNGIISFGEFSQTLKEWNLPFSHEQRYSIAAHFDERNLGHIRAEDLIAALKPPEDNAQAVIDRLVSALFGYRHHLKRVFRRLDLDDSGALDFEEFKAGLVALDVIALHSSLTDAQVQRMFDMFDSDGNKKIEYEEFSSFFENLKIAGPGKAPGVPGGSAMSGGEASPAKSEFSGSTSVRRSKKNANYADSPRKEKKEKKEKSDS